MLLATQKHNQTIKQHTHVGFWLIKAIMNKRDSCNLSRLPSSAEWGEQCLQSDDLKN